MQVDESDPAWRALAEKNEYDVRLYTNVVHMFDKQREYFKSYARSFGPTTSNTIGK